MATLLLKKSYLHKGFKEIKFHDLWNSYGVFTTMRVIGRPPKILFFKSSIPMGIFVLSHLIEIFILFDLKGSNNFNE